MAEMTAAEMTTVDHRSRRLGARARCFGFMLITSLATVTAGVGCGREVLGIAAPQALRAWTPVTAHPAQMTLIKATPTAVYVGFSDGEVFAQPSMSAQWVDLNSRPCGQMKPSSPVTSLSITASRLVASFVGTPGAPAIWHSTLDVGCWASEELADDIWNISVSPFFPYELLATTPRQAWVTEQAFGPWGYGTRPLSLGFGGVPTTVAAGIGDGGAPRAWLGDAEGNIYYSDDVAAVTALDPTTADAIPTDAIHWQPLPSPGFPRRAVVALVTHPDDPKRLWITFAGIHPDSLWVSDDNGKRWRNPHAGDLPLGAASAGAPDADQADPTPLFTAVSPVPGTAAAIVAALRPDAKGNLTSTTFWLTDGADEWWTM